MPNSPIEAELPLIWDRIGTFHEQARISYLATGLVGGSGNVTGINCQ